LDQSLGAAQASIVALELAADTNMKELKAVRVVSAWRKAVVLSTVHRIKALIDARARISALELAVAATTKELKAVRVVSAWRRTVGLSTTHRMKALNDSIIGARASITALELATDTSMKELKAVRVVSTWRKAVIFSTTHRMKALDNSVVDARASIAALEIAAGTTATELKSARVLSMWRKAIATVIAHHAAALGTSRLVAQACVAVLKDTADNSKSELKTSRAITTWRSVACRAAFRHTINKANFDIRALQLDAGAKDKQLVETQAQVVQLNITADINKKQFASLQSKFNTLNAASEKTTDDLVKAQKRIEVIKTTAESNKTSFYTLKESSDTIKNDLAEAIDRNKELEDNIAQYQADLSHSMAFGTAVAKHQHAMATAIYAALHGPSEALSESNSEIWSVSDSLESIAAGSRHDIGILCKDIKDLWTNYSEICDKYRKDIGRLLEIKPSVDLMNRVMEDNRLLIADRENIQKHLNAKHDKAVAKARAKAEEVAKLKEELRLSHAREDTMYQHIIDLSQPEKDNTNGSVV
jgi:hypothetical protein